MRTGEDVMGEALVAAGVVTREQIVAADLAEQQGAASAPTGPAHQAEVAMRNRVAAAVASGEWTREEGDAAIKAWNAAPPAERGEPAPRQVAPEAQPLAPSGAPDPWAGVELDPGFGPPLKATDYRLHEIAGGLTRTQLQSVAETLHAAKLPTTIGVQIASEIAGLAAQQLDDTGRQVLHQRTMAQLDRLWGPERDANIKVAVDFVRQLDKVRPGVLDMLNESGAGSSFGVVVQVFNHAQRINGARRK